ncbi:MAG: family 43 glycosylhydrolase [Anaerolineae bacterium]|nr:family 43 glycosylhydrolase [Anaerolineae bacterium]
MKFQQLCWRKYRRYLLYGLAVILIMIMVLPLISPIQLTQAQTATFTNPLNNSGPDPWMTYYDGNYYLATTTWGDASTGLTMRKASTIAGLKTAIPVRIWQDSTASRCCNYWAPEFRLLNGPNGLRWYFYFSGGPSTCCDGQRMHVLESAGTDPMGPYSYKAQLSDSIGGWAIDHGVMELNGSLYLLFSAWSGDYQNIYIASMSNPWTISSNRVLLSTPTYSWETQDGNVNEAPVALQHNGRTFIIYSASACWGPNYKLGMLTYNGGNPLSTSSWNKNPNPVFQRSDANNVYAPGHNGFFKSPDGTEDWIVYHANDSVNGGCDMNRATRIQKFTWNSDGTPNFGVPVSTNTSLAVPSGEGGTMVTPSPTQSPSQDPIVHYRFDESSGTTAYDASGNGQNATLVNGPTWVGGAINNAVNLDGSNDYISMPSGVVSSLGDFTIATWVRLDSISSWSRVFDFGTGTSANMFLTPQNGSTNAVRFAITTGGGESEQQITGSSALPTGSWVHVAVTKSGNTGRLYMNGSQVGSNSSMSLSPSSLGSTNQNWIGRSQYSADPYLDGQVDDFRIYNRALNASEVSSLASGGQISTPTPVINPTNTPSSTTSTYQAEDASLGGGVSVDTNHAGYYGSGFVNFPSSGGYVEYQNVDGGSGGSRILQFRFALGATSARTGQLTINGVTQNITFQPTGAWETWATMTVTVTLNPGTTNTIRLQSTGQDLANQDQMTVY